MGSSEHPKAQQDFEPAVKAMLAAFAAFTGFTISKSIDALVEPKNLDLSKLDWSLAFFSAILGSYRFWILIVVLSLLLRYIIGSAIHLNHVYVEKVPVESDKRTEIPLELPSGVRLDADGSVSILIEDRAEKVAFPISVLFAQQVQSEKQPRSKSICFLFKDFVFLVIFGVAAIFIAKAPDFSTLAFRSILYLVAGLAWGFIDWLTRDVLKWGGELEISSKVWHHETGWLKMDALQIVLTVVIAAVHYMMLPSFAPHVADCLAAFALAVTYVIFLYYDIKMLLVPPQASARP